jgi:quinol monooxygenase YgiN
MPVAVHICPDRMSREEYEQVIDELEKSGVHEGRLYHAAYGEDELQIFEVWRSKEDFEAHRDNLVGTLQGAGVNVDRIDVHPLRSEHPD